MAEEKNKQAVKSHEKRIDIDWNRETPLAQPTMRSWTVVECWCKTPWDHY